MGWQDAPEAQSDQTGGTQTQGWQSAPVDTTTPTPVFSGSVLPLTRYSDGSVGFDSNAGVVGDVKRAITGLPSLARQAGAETAANTATPQTAGQVANLAAMTTPGDMVAPGVSGTATKAANVAVPTAQELHAAANQGYDALRNLGVHYNLDPVRSMVQGTQDALGDIGLSSEVAPQTHAILNRLGNPPEDAVSVPLTGLANVRNVLGRVTQGPNPVDRLASRKAISALDDFIQNPSPEAVMAGDASAAAQTLQVANGNYAAAKRSDKLNAAGEYAQFRAVGANSGTNFDNSLRQQVRPLIDPRYPQRLSGFTRDEKDAVTGVVEGTPVRNALRMTGNVLGGGGGMHGYITGITGAGAGYEAAGFPGAAVGMATPVVGGAAKYAQNNMARSALSNADELIRQRSPLFQQRQGVASLEMQVNAPGMAAVRAGSQQSSNQSQPAYAKGGKVKKPSHEFLVSRLMALAEKAQRAGKKSTAPILNMPDDAVTAALAKAQEGDLVPKGDNPKPRTPKGFVGNPNGRTPIYSDETRNEILDLIWSGQCKSLVAVERAKGMPSRRMIYLWKDKYPEFAEELVRAQRALGDLYLDDIHQITSDVRAGILEPSAGNVAIRSSQWLSMVSDPETFSNKSYIKKEESVKVSTTHVNRIEIKGLSEDQMDALEDALRAKLLTGPDGDPSSSRED